VGTPELRATSRKPNCGKCWKCARQQLTLELMGKLEKYSEVFDLPYYHQNRTRLIGQVLARALSGASGSTADQEAYDEMKAVWGGAPLGAWIEYVKIRLRRVMRRVTGS
jgi:hypothetical protein